MDGDAGAVRGGCGWACTEHECKPQEGEYELDAAWDSESHDGASHGRADEDDELAQKVADKGSEKAY